MMVSIGLGKNASTLQTVAFYPCTALCLQSICLQWFPLQKVPKSVHAQPVMHLFPNPRADIRKLHNPHRQHSPLHHTHRQCRRLSTAVRHLHPHDLAVPSPLLVTTSAAPPLPESALGTPL